jgi:hypothetical protein
VVSWSLKFGDGAEIVGHARMSQAPTLNLHSHAGAKKGRTLKSPCACKVHAHREERQSWIEIPLRPAHYNKPNTEKVK